MTGLAIIAFLRRVPVWAWALLASAVLMAGLRSHWIGVGESRVQAVLDAERAANKLAADAQAAEAEATEQRQAAEFAAVVDSLKQENDRAKQDADRLVADLRRGAVRLRDRFTCPRAVPGAAGSAARSDEAGEGGFTVEDASVALGIARDGDAAIRQLTACQSILAAERTGD